MVKKTYVITGFDCADCAKRSEKHLNKQSNISYAKIDFTSNLLYITFNEEELSNEEVLKLLKEVDSNDLNVLDYNGEYKKTSVLNKKFWILLSRILFAVIVAAISTIFLGAEKFNLLNLILFAIADIVLLYDLFINIVKHVVHKENPLDHNLMIVIVCICAFILGSLEMGEKEFGIFDSHFESLEVALLFHIGSIIELVVVNKGKSIIMSNVSNIGNEKQSKQDEIINTFAKWYTPIIFALAIIVVVVFGIINGWEESVHTALEILVVGCPCSLVISVPLAYTSAIGLAEKNGIIVNGAYVFDELAKADSYIVDENQILYIGNLEVALNSDASHDALIPCGKQEKIKDATKIAKIARNTALFNIIFALAFKAIVLILDIVLQGEQFENLMMILSILSDSGLVLILVVNSLLILTRKISHKEK